MVQLKKVASSVVASLTTTAVVFGMIGGMMITQKEVKAANYSSNKGKVTIYEDGTVTVDFTLSEVDQTQVLYGFGICLFDEKPDLLSNDKLVNSGNIFYDSEECKHVYHQELANPIPEGTYDDTFTLTYAPTSNDIIGFDANGNQTLREGGVSLADALKTGKDWYVVVGVRTTFGGVWHTNCDLYLGQISDVAGGENFVPHEHSWNYDVEDNKIFAWCDEEKLECGNYGTGKQDAKLIDVLTADNAVYSGDPYNGASKTDNITGVTGATQTEIVYYKTDESGKTTGGDKLDTPPTDAGNYYVAFSIVDNGKEYTAVKSFDITPFDISTGTCNTEIGGAGTDSIPKTITVTVDGKEKTLTVGTDCNVEVGDKTVTITGQGNFTGVITLDKKVTDSGDDTKTTDLNQSGQTTNTDNDSNDTALTDEDGDNDDDANLDEDDADEEDDDDSDDADDDGTPVKDADGSSAVSTGATTSPVTGYDSLVNVILVIMLFALVGMGSSAFAMRKKED